MKPATQSQPKGVITGVIKGKAYFRTWSPNVKFEGKCVARHEDLMSHNHGSQPGNTDLFYYLSEPISVGNRIWDNVLKMLCWQDNYEKKLALTLQSVMRMPLILMGFLIIISLKEDLN